MVCLVHLPAIWERQKRSPKYKYSNWNDYYLLPKQAHFTEIQEKKSEEGC